ncbi:alpha/beta hydrolase [Rhodococcus sp. H36-A4]|uniref:alpha/beta fold hydrolase n=1 Tax=Rhodococcus sp. H36-A4 TaxID=3004353 RepID=UPI0022AF5434|nr:alpha/beta hydrolase [Rhodococcus sp. H36-A4]MCZ4079347.1 alpha/beta hydrolase [Rhodococcus sp. H36-A4]
MHSTTGFAPSNSIEIAYEDMGNPNDPVVLMIMGLSAQMTLWPREFCERIVHQGFRVIRFDNRDIGLSTKMDGHRIEGSMLLRLLRTELGASSKVPYTLKDMALDALGLLDYLEIPRVHVIGASMGGMIAQVFSGLYPDRVSSTAIIFSSTNEAFLPPPDPRALLPLMKGPGPDATREEIIAHSANIRRVIGSPAYPTPLTELLVTAGEMYDRNYYPAGALRHMAAVTGTGSLRRIAASITSPAVVIHGRADRLMRPAGGKAVARAIEGSKLHLIDGMGHDLPEPLWDEILGELSTNFAKAATN